MRVLGNTVVLRRSALLEVGGWDENAVCQDWGLWLRLAHHGKRHARRADYLACLRVHEQRLTMVHEFDGTYNQDQRYFHDLYGRQLTGQPE